MTNIAHRGLRAIQKCKIVSSFKNNILVRNIGGTFAIKGASVVVQLLSVPAYISYFANDGVLGVWYTLIAALNWILVFDFGVGNGLRNNLSKALAAKDIENAKRLVSTAYIVIGALSLFFIFAGELIILNIDFEAVLNYHSDVVSKGTIQIAVSIVYVGIVIQFWLKLITSVLYAMQKTALNNFLFLFGNVLLLLWVSFAHFGNINQRLIAISLIQVGAVNLPLFICTVALFFGRLRDISPSFSYFHRNAVQAVVGLGVEFFVIQIALLLVNSTNEFLISSLYDSSDVVIYQIYYKWFFAIITVFSLVVQPVWSAMTVAWYERRIAWIVRSYRRFNLTAFIGAAGAFFLAYVFPLLVDIWIGSDAVTASFETGCVFAFWVTVILFVNSSTCISNATSNLRVQLCLTVLAAIVKIPLCIALCKANFGWSSVVLANGLVLIPLLVGQTIANRALLKGAL